MELNL